MWRSNQLSYRTGGFNPGGTTARLHLSLYISFPKTSEKYTKENRASESVGYPSISRKEVFQPHLPVRLPCYDLAPITGFTLGRPFRSRLSGTPGFHGLTGGVYKARERIHRAMADARLERVSGSAPCHQVASLCSFHCNTCVAPDVRAVLI